MKVWPATDDLRKVLRHPVGGPFEATGGKDWPEDTYTFRRLREGALLTQDPTPVVVAPPAPPEPPAQVLPSVTVVEELKPEVPIEKFVEPDVKPVAPKRKAATYKEK